MTMRGDYTRALQQLARLRKPLDQFFADFEIFYKPSVGNLSNSAGGDWRRAGAVVLRR